MYPRLMDFFGFETDFEPFLARLFTTVRTVFGSRTTIRETILDGGGLMICLNAFQTTEYDFNDVASLRQYYRKHTYFNIRYLYIYIRILYAVLCPLGHDVGRTRGGAIIGKENK